MTDLEQDLRERWLPSNMQMDLADAMLHALQDDVTTRLGAYARSQLVNHSERGVYTGHLLLNKEYGLWTADVQLVFLDGVFLTREAVCDFVFHVARKRHVESGEKIVGGYAWHPRVGEAAVWEDILSRFPAEKS